MCERFSNVTLVQSGSVAYLSQGVELLLTLLTSPATLAIVPFVERAINHHLSAGTLEDVRILHSRSILQNEGVSVDIKATLDNNADKFDWTISKSDTDTDDNQVLGERLTNGGIRIIFDADWHGKSAPDWLKDTAHQKRIPTLVQLSLLHLF